MNEHGAPITDDPQGADDDLSSWESGEERVEAGDQLVVDVEGFEGPLDLLLALARTQKVDLAKISVLALAQQYLDFIAEARRLRLEIAADYLVMAAWLAFLKSKLLLPAEPSEEGEPTGAELAAPSLYLITGDDARVDAAIADAAVIPDGEEAMFQVTFPGEIDVATLGLVILSFGDQNYGGMAPVPVDDQG